MSDVEVGGSTVFPDIGAALQPKIVSKSSSDFYIESYTLNIITGQMALTTLILQGSAVIWLNLLKSGEEDTRTLHAACPVFVGSKWGKFPVNISA